MIVSLFDSAYALVVTNVSIKNNITTFIAHIHVYNKSVIKTLHYVMSVIAIEAEPFAIRCSINQATSISDISKIIVIIDLLYAT